MKHKQLEHLISLSVETGACRLLECKMFLSALAIQQQQ